MMNEYGIKKVTPTFLTRGFVRVEPAFDNRVHAEMHVLLQTKKMSSIHTLRSQADEVLADEDVLSVFQKTTSDGAKLYAHMWRRPALESQVELSVCTRSELIEYNQLDTLKRRLLDKQITGYFHFYPDVPVAATVKDYVTRTATKQLFAPNKQVYEFSFL